MIRRHWGRRTVGLRGDHAGAASLRRRVGSTTGLRMPANAAIGSGVAVGGMSPTEAAKTLQTTLAPRADRDVVLTHGKQRFTLDPDDLG